jgi:imidazole glycerol-phosphate synthase subunit HisH
MQTVALIDYGSGNLRSAEKALEAAASTVAEQTAIVVTGEPEAVAAADRIVLPGVGAFGALMDLLETRPGLVEAMDEAVHRRGAPFLGVCVGMQLLATRGLEFGATPGLDWIPGEVRRLEPGADGLKVPHMGWNEVEARPHPLFEKGAAPTMYFTHSYAFRPEDEAAVVGVTDHGGRFASAVAKDNIAGVQFHPEKSQAAGLQLISRFLEWRP